jgi:hypothetical protein
VPEVAWFAIVIVRAIVKAPSISKEGLELFVVVAALPKIIAVDAFPKGLLVDKATAAPTAIVPALIVVVPVYEFAALNLRVPLPDFTIPKVEPLIIPLMVKSAVALALLTVTVLVAPNAIGHEIVAPVPEPEGVFTLILPPSVITPEPEIVEAEEPFSKTIEVGAAVAPSVNVESASVAPDLTVNAPEMFVIFAPRVVVPEAIVKLLYEVALAGRVNVPVNITVEVATFNV